MLECRMWNDASGVEATGPVVSSPSRQPNQDGPAEYRHERAADRVPNRDVERIVRRTGEEEDDCSPGGGRQAGSERSSSAVGRGTASYKHPQANGRGDR